MDKDIQTQVREILEPQDPQAETETPEETLQQGTVDEPNPEDGEENPEEANPEGEGSEEEERKKASAFAAMRVETKKLQEQNKQLLERLAQLEQAKAPEPKPEGDKPSEKEEPQTDLEKRIALLEEQLRQTQEKTVNDQVRQEVIDLRDKYNLSADDLVEFANELENQGYKLDNLGIPLETLYRGLRYDNLVQREVDKAKRALSGQAEEAPAAGTKTSTGATKKTSTISPEKAAQDLLKNL